METIPAKTILQRNKSTAWFGCEYNMNLYKGCNHGCIYCDSRSDCYRIENFSQVRAKQDALRIVRDELMRRRMPGVVCTGAMSDPYNPFEKTELLTRHALELINACGYGVALATKSDMVVRDIDILKDIAQHSPVLCKITITALDDEMAAKLEPHAPSSSRRFAAVEQLANSGVYTGILLMPVMPFLEDTVQNVVGIVHRAARAGARFVMPSFGVTLRDSQRAYCLQALEQAFPGEGLAEKYQNRYGSRYYCSSPNTNRLRAAFEEACRETGLLFEMRDIIRGYRQGYGSKQLSFF